MNNEIKKLRDEMALAHYKSCLKQFKEHAATHFYNGFDAAAALYEQREARLIEALESCELYPNGHTNMRVKEALASHRAELSEGGA